jgi:hypothetical protein
VFDHAKQNYEFIANIIISHSDEMMLILFVNT